MGSRNQVIITRPSPGSEETAHAVATLGWAPVIAPLLVISFKPLEQLSLSRKKYICTQRFQAVIVASRQAVKALCGLYPAALRSSLRVLAVGNQTAQDAQAAGFAYAKSAQGTATELLALCHKLLKKNAGPVLLVSAKGAGCKTVEGLQRVGFEVEHLALYDSQPVSCMPDILMHSIKAEKVHSVLFFSALTASAFIRLANSVSGLQVQLSFIEAIAISSNVHNVLSALPWKDIKTAAHPTAQSIIERLGKFPA